MEIEEDSSNHITLDIINEDALLSSIIKDKMDFNSLSHCVSRVPEELYKANEEKYFPSLVSIGPFHHGNHTLKSMEDKKWRYLNTLITRKANAESTLDNCIKSLRQVEQKARKFYGGESSIQISSDHFIEMLLLDACFIIEFFLEYASKNLRRRDDPCFSSSNSLSHIRCDILLFENQLPFFILDQIFDLLPIPKQCRHLSLIDLALFFFKKLIPESEKMTESQTHHLLDLIRQHYLPTYSTEILPTYTLPNPNVHTYNIPQASRLLSLGISVERATLTEIMTNIQFSNGKLKIPCLEIHSYTEILLRNIIAMEHCNLNCSKHVTSYVVLMEGLIRSEKDVRVLQEREILIDGHHGREREIVFLLQRLHVDVKRDDFYYRGLCEKVSKHETRGRDVCWVRISDGYHKTKFGLAGFGVVILLLVFLITGALFSTVYVLLHHFQ